MFRELHELSLTVARWSAAIEMPDVIQARDDVAQRLVDAVFARRPEPPEEPPLPDVEDSDLPIYVTF
jgi:hypothetical protein